jgi:1-acyl-sn-glycerol-3-phosphate acyltransferase
MNLVTSIAFWIFINAWGAIIPILYLPAFIIKSSRLADHGAKLWSKVGLLMLKKLCKIDYELVGMEKLPKEPCIIACKHQSMWETIVMHLVVNRPAYIYKKELEKIPFYGWFLKVMTGIAVDRNGGATALKDLIKETKAHLSTGHFVVIFPQGTRVPVGAKTTEYPYQPGIAAMYSSCNTKVVPAALNSGMFWAKGRLLKKPGKIILEFLDPIEPGLSRKEFMSKLEEVTEKRSDELIKITSEI